MAYWKLFEFIKFWDYYSGFIVWNMTEFLKKLYSDDEMLESFNLCLLTRKRGAPWTSSGDEGNLMEGEESTSR